MPGERLNHADAPDEKKPLEVVNGENGEEKPRGEGDSGNAGGAEKPREEGNAEDAGGGEEKPHVEDNAENGGGTGGDVAAEQAKGEPANDEAAGEQPDEATAEQSGDAADKAAAAEQARRQSKEGFKARMNETEDRIRKVDEILNTERKMRSAGESDASAESEEPDAAAEETAPLTAVSVDMSEELREVARDEAERAVNEEVAQKGFISRLWKGTLFNRYYKRKYAQQLMSGERKVEYNGKQVTLAEELVQRQGDKVVERFTLGAVEGAAAIHTQAGERNQEADAETTQRVKAAIEAFATAKIPEDGDLETLQHNLSEAINFQNANARDEGRPFNRVLANNYGNVALQAREMVEHGMAIEKVMEGFKVYEGESRSRIRSEAYQGHIDKALDWLENHGLVTTAQIAAGAAGIACAFAQTGARAVGGAAAGIAASSLMSGVKAYNKYTHDRQTMLRSTAMGLEYSGQAPADTVEQPDGEDKTDEEIAAEKARLERFGNRRARRTQKYEAKLNGTVYQMTRATDLIKNLQAAMAAREEGKGSDALLQAIAEARTRVNCTDLLGKDLIAYSSAGKVNDEALELDLALIRAEKTLAESDKEKLDALKKGIQDGITQDINSKDKEFRKDRRMIAIKKCAKTGFTAAGTFLVSQEVMAVMDPAKIGVFEKAGLLKTTNNADAQQTILAKMFTGARSEAISSVQLRGDQTVEREYLKAQGYTETEVRAPSAHIESTSQEVPLSDAAGRVQAHVRYANNGTRVSDGNELRIYGRGDTSLVSGMRGTSTMSGGRSVNFDQVSSDNNLRGLVTLNNGQQFLVKPHLNDSGKWAFGDGNGVYELVGADGTPMGTAAFGNSFKTFSVGFMDSVNTDGSIDFISGATVVGRGGFAGTIRQMVETAVEDPGVYELTRIPTVSLGGVFLPETPSEGLGVARPRGEATATSASADNPDDIFEVHADAADEAGAATEGVGTGGAGSGTTAEGSGATPGGTGTAETGTGTTGDETAGAGTGEAGAERPAAEGTGADATGAGADSATETGTGDGGAETTSGNGAATVGSGAEGGEAEAEGGAGTGNGGETGSETTAGDQTTSADRPEQTLSDSDRSIRQLIDQHPQLLTKEGVDLLSSYETGDLDDKYAHWYDGLSDQARSEIDRKVLGPMSAVSDNSTMGHGFIAWWQKNHAASE